MAELSSHVAKCDGCREFLESVAQVSVQVMPLLAEAHGVGSDGSVPAGMRDRFLSRLASHSAGEDVARIGAFVMAKPMVLSPFERKNPFKAENLDKTSERRSEFRITSAMWLVLEGVAAVAVCAAVGYVAFHLGARMSHKAPAQTVVQAPLVSPPPTAAPDSANSERLAILEAQTAALQNELGKAREELSDSQVEKKSLSDSLLAVKAQLATIPASEEPSSRTSPDSQTNAVQLASMQEQVDRLTRRLAESEIKLGTEKQASDELAAKLDATQYELQRERDMKSAKSAMGDVVAARNLHIVDVYDADPSGKRQRSFGRVFYIENKSLVFYAYDLDAPENFRKNVTFHVWGGKAGVNDVSHSLGILHKDDDGQGRWAMTFDDPAVLAEINSVFVTAEPADRHTDAPRGKKVLYAFFGNKPNHP